MAFPDSQRIAELIAPVVEARGLDIEQIKVAPAGKKTTLSIRLDSDDRPSLDNLEEVSNEISATLDAAEETGAVNFGPGYTLEVSTPGVDLPLTQPRHWRRNRGRLVKVNGGGSWRIGALDDTATQVILIASTKGQKVRAEDVVGFPLSEVQSAVVEIEFSAAPPQERELAEAEYDVALHWREENK